MIHVTMEICTRSVQLTSIGHTACYPGNVYRKCTVDSGTCYHGDLYRKFTVVIHMIQDMLLLQELNQQPLAYWASALPTELCPLLRLNMQRRIKTVYPPPVYPLLNFFNSLTLLWFVIHFTYSSKTGNVFRYYKLSTMCILFVLLTYGCVHRHQVCYD